MGGCRSRTTIGKERGQGIEKKRGQTELTKSSSSQKFQSREFAIRHIRHHQCRQVADVSNRDPPAGGFSMSSPPLEAFRRAHPFDPPRARNHSVCLAHLLTV